MSSITRKKIRKHIFEKIKVLVEDEFNTIISTEEIKIGFFCENEFQVAEFELLLENEFGKQFNLENDFKIGQVLDVLCRY